MKYFIAILVTLVFITCGFVYKVHLDDKERYEDKKVYSKEMKVEEYEKYKPNNKLLSHFLYEELLKEHNVFVTKYYNKKTSYYILKAFRKHYDKNYLYSGANFYNFSIIINEKFNKIDTLNREQINDIKNLNQERIFLTKDNLLGFIEKYTYEQESFTEDYEKYILNSQSAIGSQTFLEIHKKDKLIKIHTKGEWDMLPDYKPNYRTYKYLEKNEGFKFDLVNN